MQSENTHPYNENVYVMCLWDRVMLVVFWLLFFFFLNP